MLRRACTPGMLTNFIATFAERYPDETLDVGQDQIMREVEGGCVESFDAGLFLGAVLRAYSPAIGVLQWTRAGAEDFEAFLGSLTYALSDDVAARLRGGLPGVSPAQANLFGYVAPLRLGSWAEAISKVSLTGDVVRDGWLMTLRAALKQATQRGTGLVVYALCA